MFSIPTEHTKPLPVEEIDSDDTRKYTLNGKILRINYRDKSLKKDLTQRKNKRWLGFNSVLGLDEIGKALQMQLRASILWK